MNRPLGIALLVAGIILLIFGVSSADSFASHWHKFFTGTPTDKAVWLTIGGAIATVAGLALTLGGRRADV